MQVVRIKQCAITFVIASVFGGLPARGQDESQKTLSSPAPAATEPNVPVDSKWLAPATRILEIGSEERTTDQQRDAAYQELASLKPSKDDDARLQFAFVLVAMKEKKWEGALSRIEDLLEHDPNYIPASAAKARVFLLTNKQPQAIAELEALGKHFVKPSSVVTPDQLESSARFLGLAVGYFEGPGKNSIKSTTLDELSAIGEKLTGDIKTSYEGSRQAITEEYRVLTEEGEEAFKNLREGLEKEAEEMRKQLEAERAKAVEQAESARKQLESNWSRQNSQWQDAWNSCQSLIFESNQLNQQRATLLVDLNRLPPPRVDQDGNVDRFDQLQYTNAYRSIQLSISNIDQQLIGLQTRFALARAQGLRIEQQLKYLRAQMDRLGMQHAAQNDSFGKIAASIRSKELQATKAEPKKSTAQLRRERAFTTYDDFNFHKEKRLLLDQAVSK